MKTLGVLLVVILTLVMHLSGIDAQSAGKLLPAIEDLMSAKEFEAAGLRKLTPDELTALNVWLRKYTLAMTQSGGQDPQTVPKPLPTADLIESQIDGEFSGWDGETIFKLRNGQIWQQSSYAYAYHYAYAPKVLIYKSGGGYKMEVDGVSSEISVRRLK